MENKLDDLWQDSELFDNCEELPYDHLSHNEWEALRYELGAIGGSDAGGICGVVKSDYFDPNKLMLEKAKFIPSDFTDTIYTAWGQDTEAVSKAWYQWYEEDKEGERAYSRFLHNRRQDRRVNQVTEYPAMIRNRDFPWLVANIDGLITDHRWRKGMGIFESKTGTSQYAQQHIGAIPPANIYQVNCYMMITGLEYCELTQLLDNRQYNVLPIEPNEFIQNHILRATEEFNERVEKAKTIIANSANDKQAMNGLMEIMYDSASDLYQQFLTDKQKEREDLAEVIGTDEVLKLATEFIHHREKRKAHNEQEKLIKNKIRSLMYKKGIRKMKWTEGEAVKSVSFHKQLVVTIDKEHNEWE